MYIQVTQYDKIQRAFVGDSAGHEFILFRSFYYLVY